MKNKRLLSLLTVAIIAAILMSFTAFAVSDYGTPNTWVKEDGEWYFYDHNSELVTGDFFNLAGTWYYFDYDGRMVTNEVVWSNDYNAYYVINGDGTQSYQVTYTGWICPFGTWFYIKEDGTPAQGEFILSDGAIYAFNWQGRMYNNEEFWLQGGYRRAKAGGALYLNEWYQDKNSNWFYYDANACAVEGPQLINGTVYYFDYEGQMLTDTMFWFNDALFFVGNDGVVKQVYEGWNYFDGKYYYAVNGEYGLEMLEQQFYQVGDYIYYFDFNGVMAQNEIFWNYRNDSYYYAQSTGAILMNGWGKYSVRDIYADANGVLCYDGVYEIDGQLYYFIEGGLNTIPGEYGYWYYDSEYYVKDFSGALMRNEWRYDSIGYPDEMGWAYYGEDGRRYNNCVGEINGVTYYFNDYGVIETNLVREMEDGYVLVIDAAGNAAKITDGWFTHPETGEWMYAVDGDRAEGIYEINGVIYAFEYGYMMTDSYYYAYDYENDFGACFLFGSDGALITQPGWHTANGYYYYVCEDGTLYEGWLWDTYYMYPAMAANTVFYDWDTDTYYLADNAGVAIPLSGNGLFNHYDATLYLRNGVPTVNGWEYVNGYWYYFDADGWAYKYGVCEINGVKYLFDIDGKLHTTGWLYMGGDYYYAGADGVAYTGMQAINGITYYFSDFGYLREINGRYRVDGVYYELVDGMVVHTYTPGWNFVNGYWYYLNEYDYFYCDELVEINGVEYYFDGYEMAANTVTYAYGAGHRIFDANGQMVAGWYNIGGKWAYANPDTMRACTDGEYVIDGQKYIFSNYYMMSGTFIWGNTLYTTDASGAVISEEEIPEEEIVTNGWYYSGYGEVYYMVDGVAMIGWMGDYFFDEYGCLAVNEIVEYNGAPYCFDAQGRYVRGGWYEFVDGDYVFAYADGTLAQNTWIYSGGKYYYVNYIWMVTDRIITIDDERHEFNEDGVWQGEVKSTVVTVPVGLADGWQYLNKNWYYYHAGEPVYGAVLINGVEYAFNNKGMVTNNFYNEYNGYKYYGADGVMVPYVGWVYLEGQWLYFNTDNTVRTGWIAYGNGWYYTTRRYSDDLEKSIFVTLTNEYMVYNNRIYWFDASGFSTGAIYQTGWFYVDGEWYYLNNGKTVTYEQTIDGVEYYFDYDGMMMTNCYAYGYYYGDDGARLAAPGWHLTSKGWVYIDDYGYACGDGMYLIDNVAYSFYNGILVG